MDELRPVLEVGIGTTVLLGVLVIHGAGMLLIQRGFERFWPAMAARRRRIVRNLFLSALILGLLVTHYLEIMVWAATLAGIGAFADLRQAFYFAGGAYTTYGSQGAYLPEQWRLLGFMIATSGLFTFGWTTGILVSIVSRFFGAGPQRARELA